MAAASTPDETELLANPIREPIRQYIQHAPEPKQAAFLYLTHMGVREALYGGAAGGGKSDALLMDSLNHVDVPGYSAVLFRKTYKELELPSGLIPRSHQWLDKTDAQWKGDDKQWKFPSGATITFGYLDAARDRYRYQSTQFNMVGFDELTQFREEDYRYLFSRLRRLAGSAVPSRVRGATNPGGFGHDWVKARLVNETERRSSGRWFIPARLDDNPHLDREDYLRSLDELDPATRSMLLEGNWDAAVGAMFRREWFKIIPRALPFTEAVRAWDLAATEPSPDNLDPDYTAGCLMSLAETGGVQIHHMHRVRQTAGKVEDLILKTAREDGPSVPVWIEEERGSSGKFVVAQIAKRLPGYRVHGWPVTGDKATRAMPVASLAERGGVSLIAGPWIPAFLDELAAFTGGRGSGAHDDMVDATSLALSRLVQRGLTFADIVGRLEETQEKPELSEDEEEALRFQERQERLRRFLNEGD